MEEWIQLSSGNIEGQTFKLDGYSQRQNDLFSNADIPIDEKLVWMDTAFVIGKTNTLNFSFNHIGAYAPVASGGSGISGVSYSQDKMTPIMATTKQNANVKLAGILILTEKSLIFKRPDSIIPFNLSQITKIEFDKNKILIQLGVSPGIYEYEVKDIARWRMHYNIIRKLI